MKILIVFLFAGLFNFAGFAQDFQKDGSAFYKSSGKLEFGSARIDTIEIQDPASGNIILSTRIGNRKLLRIDGDSVFSESVVKFDQDRIKEFDQYIFASIRKMFERQNLMPGNYSFRLCNVAVDRQGEIAYFEYYGVYCTDINGFYRRVNDFGGDYLNRIIAGAPPLIPRTFLGNSVCSYIPEISILYEIEVDSYGKFHFRKSNVKISKPLRIRG